MGTDKSERPNLHTIEDQVHDRESFFRFVEALIADREDEIAEEKENASSPYGAEARGWQNVRVDDYLEAALAWAKAWSRASERPVPHDWADWESGWKRLEQLLQEPSWRLFAAFLHAGKYYE